MFSTLAVFPTVKNFPEIKMNSIFVSIVLIHISIGYTIQYEIPQFASDSLQTLVDFNYCGTPKTQFNG